MSLIAKPNEKNLPRLILHTWTFQCCLQLVSTFSGGVSGMEWNVLKKYSWRQFRASLLTRCAQQQIWCQLFGTKCYLEMMSQMNSSSPHRKSGPGSTANWSGKSECSESVTGITTETKRIEVNTSKKPRSQWRQRYLIWNLGQALGLMTGWLAECLFF